MANDLTNDINTCVCMPTTIDNPYDPFTQFTLWYMYDIEKGYMTCELLGRLAHTSDELSDQENDEEIERATDELIANDLTNNYKKVLPPPVQS